MIGVSDGKAKGVDEGGRQLFPLVSRVECLLSRSITPSTPDPVEVLLNEPVDYFGFAEIDHLNPIGVGVWYDKDQVPGRPPLLFSPCRYRVEDVGSVPDKFKQASAWRQTVGDNSMIDCRDSQGEIHLGDLPSECRLHSRDTGL